MSLFCFFVAMEEISWGQRILGYRPPTYFLEHNFQQEFNIHNIVGTDYRKLALQLVIVGYGIALPLAGRLRLTTKLIDQFGLVTPPIPLIPAFLIAIVLYSWYPWSHSGEWVEAILALSFLFSALHAVQRFSLNHTSAEGSPRRSPSLAAGVTALTIAMGLVSAVLARHQGDGDISTIANARIEVETLKQDFLSGQVRPRCNRHKRLYTFAIEYEQHYLFGGAFANLQSQGLPGERAKFLLDPWNSPYWIRDRCVGADKRRVQFVYSFGPNRRRESTETEILGDDIGIFMINQQ